MAPAAQDVLDVVNVLPSPGRRASNPGRVPNRSIGAAHRELVPIEREEIMAERSLPSWKQVFDSIERRVGPRIDEFARSEEFAALAALNRRSQTELTRRLEQVSRRALHVMNLPAGSDMNRLLTHIAQLEREVRDLRKQVTDRNDAEFLASLSTRRSHKAESPLELPSTSQSGSTAQSGSNVESESSRTTKEVSVATRAAKVAQTPRSTSANVTSVKRAPSKRAPIKRADPKVTKATPATASRSAKRS